VLRSAIAIAFPPSLAAPLCAPTTSYPPTPPGHARSGIDAASGSWRVGVVATRAARHLGSAQRGWR
jgi:hypothetical protein